MQRFDPVDVERSLDIVGKLWMVSFFYAGFNRPIHVGPLRLHVTLWAIVTPFLLGELRRLRTLIALPQVERSLRAALVFGVASYASGVVWGTLPTVICLTAMVVAVLAFGIAMASLAETHGAADVAAQWRRTGRLITVLAICWTPIAVVVLALGWSSSVVDMLVLGGVLSAGVVLLRLTSATWRTRTWLEAQVAEPRPAG